MDTKDALTKQSKNRKENGSVLVSTIVDFKPISSDPIVVKETSHSFDIVTTERVFSLGCFTILEKETWLTALQSIKDNAAMRKNAYKMVGKDLGIEGLSSFAV